MSLAPSATVLLSVFAACQPACPRVVKNCVPPIQLFGVACLSLYSNSTALQTFDRTAAIFRSLWCMVYLSAWCISIIAASSFRSGKLWRGAATL